MRKLLIITAIFCIGGIAFGQSFKPGGVLMVHQWQTSVDDATLEQMVEFWEKNIMSELDKLIPEASTFIVKGIAEDNKNSIATCYYYESLEDLRKYFNEDGTPTEAGGAVFAKLMPATEEFSAKFGEFVYTAWDWVVIK